ncbi:MAG: hypothetical protein JNM70_13890 [Anaerolineae bacterium]|nr:hypothetical protein [Anaerolineae bacterium]
MGIRRHPMLWICLLLAGLLGIVPAVGAQAAVQFALTPSAPALDVNATFTTTVQVQTNGQAVDGAEIHLDFDPAMLEVISVVPGAALGVAILPPSFDNAVGSIDYAAGTFSPFPTATFDLLTITFRAKAAGTSAIRIPAADVPRKSDVTFAGSSYIALTAPVDLGSVTIHSGTVVTPEPPIVTGPALAAQVVREGAGETVSVQMNLIDAPSLYALQVHCAVNPAVLVGVERMDGAVFQGGNSYFVDGGFQADGHWMVAATLLNPAPAFAGSGTAFHLRYRVAGAGTTPIRCEALAVDADGYSVGLGVVGGSFSTDAVPQPTPVEPTPMPVVTPMPTPEPTPIIVEPPPSGSAAGLVRLQARADHSGVLLTLLAGGPAGVTLGQIPTLADGSFRFDNLAPGSYAVQVYGEGYMALIKSFEVSSAGTVLPMITLRAGDTNGDQRIDLTDAALIGANFGLTGATSPPSADINRDSAVNIIDLALIGGNFGLVGPLSE